MFSPIGKKKVLLQIKRAKEMGHKDPLGRVMALLEKNSPDKHKSSDSSPSPTKRRSTDGGSPDKKVMDGVMSSSRLDKLLKDQGVAGVVTRRIMESTVRYNPATDTVVLKAFQSRNIAYDLFRHYLHSSFWLSFTDDEYEALLQIFDPSDNGCVDGYQFMIAFIRLGGMRKDQHAAEKRTEQQIYQQQQKDTEDRRLRENEKKNDVAADFNFDEATREVAMKKLAAAAKKFDPGHPSSPSLEAFEGKYMSAAVLREMLKRVFNLRVTGKELGAILEAFADADKKEKGDKTATSESQAAQIGAAKESVQISCNDFLRQFFRLGIEGRDKEKQEQRRKQQVLDKLAREEAERKLSESENKMSLAVDYEFSAVDEARAQEKLKDASTRYDKNAPGCQSLDGFECESLSPGAFRDLVRRTFGLVLTNKELGFVIRKYDKAGTGRVTCSTFLTSFMKLGQTERHKHHLAQLDRQRRMNELAEMESEQKIREVQQGATKLKINFDFTPEEAASANRKLTECSQFFDKSRGGALTSFDPLTLTPVEFKRAIKRTFNISVTPAELGALVVAYDKEGKGSIKCQDFLNAFIALGLEERDRMRITQVKKNRDGERAIRAEEEKKRSDLLNKTDIEIDFDFTDDDRDSALAKMLAAATKYDRSHPAAMSLDGFNCLSMTAAAWKEIVRRTFNLKLRPREAGALVRHFDKSEGNVGTEVECGEFLTIFLQLGFAERGRQHKEQLDRQRAEDKQRAEDEAAKLKATTERAGANLQVDLKFTEKDMDSCLAKMIGSSEKFDKSHPAAPDLSCFDISSMSAGLFREKMKSCFNIKLEPRELGYCVCTYGTQHDLSIKAIEFLTKFLIMGKQSRYEKHRAFLVKQRAAIKAAKKDAEDKLNAQFEKAELSVDLTNFSDDDLEKAMAKVQAASAKFDKTHPAAPSTAGFTGGAMKPGEFRELVRRTFNLWLRPQELAALVHQFSFDAEHKSGKIDSKAFLIRFVKLGFEARAQQKATVLEKQRLADQEKAQEAARKKRIAEQKMVTDVDADYGEVDRTSVYAKMTSASAKYDKNAPGCASLEAFDAQYLTPIVFREIMKRTFNISLAPKELACLIEDFDNGQGNVDCQSFIISFIKLGAEERAKFKLVMLERQRANDVLRRTEHDRKMKEAEDKMTLKISYDYTEEEKNSAFVKMAHAAKKYDKNAPGCMSLDGFEQRTMAPVVFREMLKRTFGLVLSGPELGAIMNYFDKKGRGVVPSHNFLIHFLKVGQAEREKDHMQMLQALRKDAEERRRVEEETLAAMWAKTELKVTQTFSEADKAEAMEKLGEAAFKFDPASPGPMGLTAFQAQYLSPAVFREMLKRSFNLRVTDAELAALIDEFQSPSADKHVDCQSFMVRFTQLGTERRSVARVAQVTKNRAGLVALREEHAVKKKAADDKMLGVADYSYSKADFTSALDKVRTIAGNYDRGHPSSPSLSGFQGANMLPHEFKDMLVRTFHVALSGKELGALVKFFDTSGTRTIDSQEFLAHFFKLQRQEQDKRRKGMIEKEREVRGRAREHEEQLERLKSIEESSKCKYTKADEASFMRKLRASAQEYAVDSAALQEPLQAFKGPALSPLAFRDIFGRIFGSKNRFTFPEMGVLLSILDNAGTGTLDGPRFLNWFYKLGRVEGRIMLGEAEDDVTLQALRANASQAFAAALAAASSGSPKADALEPYNQPARRQKNPGSAAALERAGEEEREKFTRQTLDQSWILPGATEAHTVDESDPQALEDAFAPLAVGRGKARSGSAREEDEDLEKEMTKYNATLPPGMAPPAQAAHGSSKSKQPARRDQHQSEGDAAGARGKVLIVRDDYDASAGSGSGAKKAKKKEASSPGGFYFPSLLQQSASSPIFNIAPTGLRDLF